MYRRALLLLMLGLMTIGLDEATAGEPVVGRLHPNLRLPTIDRRQTIDLRDFKGQKVLLIQFASW